MGVLRSSAEKVNDNFAYCKDTTIEKVTADCNRAKKALDMYIEVFANTSPVKRTAEMLRELLDQVANLRYVLWSKEKAYAFFCYLSKQLNLLLAQISEYTSYPATMLMDTLGNFQLTLVNFISITFDKIDEDLVSPVCYKTVDGAFAVASTTKNVAFSASSLAQNNIMIPVTEKFLKPTGACMDLAVVQPLRKSAASTKNCVLSTTAYLDTKFGLAEWLLAVATLSQKYDKALTGGAVLSKTGSLLEHAKIADKKYLSGQVTEVVVDARDTFLAAKRKNSNTVTSPGAPVTKI